MYGFAIVIEVFEVKKINYLVILDLPPAKVTASYRTIFAIGSIVNVLVCFFIILCFTKQTQAAIRLPFGENLSDLGQLLAANYWLIFPTLLPLLNLIVSLIRMKKNHSQIAFFMMVVLYKMLTPWKHRVTFPLFYAGDVLTSYTGIIRDVSKIIYSGPHSCWLEFFLVNIPGTARMIQCYKRM